MHYNEYNDRLLLWQLICAALRIPYKLAGTGPGRKLFVPPMYEKLARYHFSEVAAEGCLTDIQPARPPARHNTGWTLSLMGLLMLWHGITQNWWGTLPGLSPDFWRDTGALDVWKTLHGEPFRAVTALTLHADSNHLFTNILFGTPFLTLLCRRTGIGPGMLLTLCAGTLGNLANAIYRQSAHSSIGFSTALFGIVGVYTGLLIADELRLFLNSPHLPPRLKLSGLRRAFIFLAAGVAVLAMLGADTSAKTDYAAHIFGLIAGLLTGLVTGLSRLFFPVLSKREEMICGILAVVLTSGAWCMALWKSLH